MLGMVEQNIHETKNTFVERPTFIKTRAGMGKHGLQNMIWFNYTRSYS